MKHTIKLSRRLTNVASFLSPGSLFADIGSDHAYLPCYICLQDNEARAIAGEINEGPYLSACKTVESYQLTNVVDVRLGDGLEVLNKNEVTEIVIAGMGGSLIKSILDDGRDKLLNVKRIIVQPNVEEQNVRSWLLSNGFKLTNEIILEENNHIYEIIVGDKADEINSSKSTLEEKQLFFGPLLMSNPNPVFYKKWRSEHSKRAATLEQIKKANTLHKEKIRQFEMELDWIEEVLQNEKKYY
ncbi:tRNA (adenine(22)-N(1))-methyltransferase [Virgibacillus alimentarius]|uniref:tRNA (adenine(22)-N(1))-methyltransferase n=1 Tax=Virgibacillus alimentarius TaxID=698769 RepID=UPI0004939131|nr:MULTISPECIES: class I SAM-dependent methyltransferase [Virgibacillus]HLR66475.1 class I SAM-dependent methyltransferase [Virgibacillus sp.]